MHTRFEPAAIRFLRMPDLVRRRGHQRSTTYRQVNAGLLTPPVRLTANTSAWPEHEIDAIDRARIAGADDSAIRTLVKELVDARKAAA